MSKNVVIAGTGALAKHVLDALLEAGDEFNVTVFSRSAKPELEARGIKVRVVDYTFLPSLSAALMAGPGEPPDTILSYIVDLLDQDSQALATRNLLSAAKACPTVRRFVPAEYANDVARFPDPPSCEWDKLLFRRELVEQKDLEYTLMSIGIFMDFFVPNGRKKYFPDGEGLPIDIQAAASAGKKKEDEDEKIIKATIPGNTKDDISFTTGDDVGRGMVRLLRQPFGSWGEYTYLSGDKVTWEKVASLVSRATGLEVEKEYVSVEELGERTRKAREATAGDGVDWGLFLTELWEYFGNTSEVLPPNSACFEGMETTKLGDWIERWYGKRSEGGRGEGQRAADGDDD